MSKWIFQLFFAVLGVFFCFQVKDKLVTNASGRMKQKRKQQDKKWPSKADLPTYLAFHTIKCLLMMIGIDHDLVFHLVLAGLVRLFWQPRWYLQCIFRSLPCYAPSQSSLSFGSTTALRFRASSQRLSGDDACRGNDG